MEFLCYIQMCTMFFILYRIIHQDMEYGYIGHGFNIHVVLVQFKCTQYVFMFGLVCAPQITSQTISPMDISYIFSPDMYFQFSSEFVFRLETLFGFASWIKTTLPRTNKFHGKIYRITSGFGKKISLATIIPGNRLVRFSRWWEYSSGFVFFFYWPLWCVFGPDDVFWIIHSDENWKLFEFYLDNTDLETKQ